MLSVRISRAAWTMKHAVQFLIWNMDAVQCETLFAVTIESTAAQVDTGKINPVWLFW